MDINTAVSTYCDQYYTKEALFRLLRTNKIDPGNITISDDELNILVSTDQYARFVTLQIAENLKARFTANKSTVYRQRYLNNEADLLSKAIAPFIASSYIPDERREGRVTGINGVHTNLRARGKMLETAIDYCLTVYHEHGYMPQLDQTLKPVGAILPSGFSRTGSIDIRGGNVDSVSLQDLHSVIKEVAWNAGIRAGVKSLTKKQKIARLQSKYGISSDEAERIYEKFLEEFSYINILQKDNGKSYERPLLERHGIYPRLYLWQYILNDTRAKRKGSLLDIPHTWRMAAKIGFTSAISSGRWGNVRDASAYRDTIFGKIFEHKKIEYMGAVMSFVAKEEERTLPLVVSRERKRALKGRRLWGADKTNPYLYSDYIDSQVFIKANSKKISDRLEETVSERNSVLKWFQKTKNAKAIKAYKKPPSKKSKKRRGLNFLDLILAVPALVIDAITFLATDAALAGVSVLGKLGIVSEDSFLRTIFSGNMEGGLWDKILLSWDGMKFTFSGLKFVLKDSIVGAIPGAIVAVLSGSPLLGGIVSFTMFAPKFFGDFTQMFAMSGPAGDIVTKIVEDFGEKSLSGGEILVKSLGSGVYIGAPLFILSALFGLPIGTAALITVGVVGVRAADLAIFEKVLSPRFIDAGAIDASTAQEVLFKSKYLLNFGTPSLGLVIAGAVTGNIPLLILGGAGFTTSAVSDFFRNSLFDSMSIKSGTDLVSSIHGVTTFTLGPAIIGGAIGGPVGAVIGGAIGGVTGISFTLLKHTVSDIAIDPRMRVFAEDESKMIEAQRKLISFNRNSFTTDAERGILRNFDPRTGVDGNIDSLLRSKGYDFKIQDLRDWGLNDADIERLFRGRATFSGTVIGVKNFNFELKSLKENVEAVRGEFLRDFVNEDKLATDLGKGTSATAESSRTFLEREIPGYRDLKLGDAGNVNELRNIDLSKYFEGSKFELNLKFLEHLTLSDIASEEGLVAKLADLRNVDPGRLVDIQNFFTERGLEGGIDFTNNARIARALGNVNIAELSKEGILNDLVIKSGDLTGSIEELTGFDIRAAGLSAKVLQGAPWSISKIPALMRSDIKLPIPGMTHATFADISPAMNSGFIAGIGLSLVGVSPVIAVATGVGVMGARLVLSSIYRSPETSLPIGAIGEGGKALLEAFSHSINVGMVTFVVADLLLHSIPVAGMVAAGVTAGYTALRFILKGKGWFKDGGGIIKGIGAAKADFLGKLGVPDWAIKIFSLKGAFDVGMVIQLDDSLMNPAKFISTLGTFTLPAIISSWGTLIFGFAGAYGLAALILGAGFGLATAGLGLGILVVGYGIDWLVKGITGFDIGHWILGWIKTGISDVFSWFGNHAMAPISWGFDILITMMLLIFRTDFDIDEFVRTIVTTVVIVAIFMNIFGGGAASGGTNSNTSNIATNNHTKSGTVGFLVSPYSGKIVNIEQNSKILADTVYIKNSEGEVSVHNIYNPYLYIGEHITKGSFIGNTVK